MRLKELIQKYSDIRQSNWVKIDDYNGIYIASISDRQSVIACYDKKKPIYMTVESSNMCKIGRRKDYNLFKFATKHILWSNPKRKWKSDGR